MAARGDSAALRQNAITSLASNFSGIENAVKENQANLSGIQPVPRPLCAQGRGHGAAGASRVSVRRVWGARADSRQRGLCDSQSATGQLRHRHSRCGFAQGAYTVSFVLQQQGSDWKLGGFYAKPTQIAGHDGNWFADRAREFKTKGQLGMPGFTMAKPANCWFPCPSWPLPPPTDSMTRCRR